MCGSAAHEQIAELEDKVARLEATNRPRAKCVGFAMQAFVWTLVAASLPALYVALWILGSPTK